MCCRKGRGYSDLSGLPGGCQDVNHDPATFVPCPPLDVRMSSDELLARSPHCSTSPPDQSMSIIP